jgi:type II secretory pathway predicted ATPase ExeA
MDVRSRFHFHCLPFTREIAVDHLFRIDRYTEAVDAVVLAIESRMSACVIAPAGSGKTVLARTITERLPEARYRVRYTAVTGLSKRDMCREIALAMSLPPAGAYNHLVRRIQEAAVALTDTDAVRPVLILDDAHELRSDVIGMLRALTNFDMDSRLVLSIVLCGQPPLAALLRRAEHEDMARRIVHYAVLGALSREEVQQYVAHRCAVAGAVTVPFDQGSFDAIYEVGRGNLRATDVIALKSLEVADRRNRDMVDATCVVEARRFMCP